MQKSTNRTKTQRILGAAALGMLVTACAPADNTAQDSMMIPQDNVEDSMMKPQDNGVSADDSMMMSRMYADGTYSAIGNYVSPAGAEEVEIQITLQGDVVTDAVFTPKAEHPTSVRKQSDFNAGYKTEVVGKSIDDISLGVVNGSSLAPKGFMDALAKIKAEAQA